MGLKCLLFYKMIVGGKIIGAHVPVAQRIRAFACGAKGRAFESPQGRL
jgi:hypothetical protein